MFKEVSTSERWLMLNEADTPTFVMKVISCEDKGKYHILKCEDLEGQIYNIAVFDRDVALCVKEWGINPLQWEYIKAEKPAGKNRFHLIPVPKGIAVNDIEC